MGRHHEATRAVLAAVLGAGALVLGAASGCGREDRVQPPPTAQTGEFLAEPAPPRPVKLDLVADLPDAWVGYGNAAHILDKKLDDQFSQGWYAVQDQGPEKRSIWSRGQRSVIEITVIDPRAQVLELDLEPAPGEGKLPHQSLRLFWNDHELGRFTLDWKRQILRVKLPAEMQRTGLNRLTFSPLYWISPLASRSTFDPRPVAFQLRGVRFAGTGVAGSESTTWLEVSSEGERIEQPANSMIVWHYALPNDPQFHVTLRWDLPPETQGLLWQWVLQDSEGDEKVLAERSPSGLGQESLTLDLSAYAGQMVGLQSVFSSAGNDAGSAGITLEAPSIQGDEASPTRVAAPRQPYNVLVVLFDTLRPDHLEPYGSTSVSTPALKKFAATGFTFEEAHANASWTRPSIASLWTGLHPSGHRLAGRLEVLPESVPYLPEILSEAGYLTLSISNNAYFSSDFGFDRGFSELYPYFSARKKVLHESPSPEEQAERVWQQFLGPSFENPEGQPVFAVLHEIDPHSPYEAPDSFSAPYALDYAGNIDGWQHALKEHLLVLKAVNNYGDWLSPADKEQMRALYKGEVSFVDAYFGALLKHLEQAELRENTLVVFLSDHGEQLFDHGAWGHGSSVYQEELKIPLIFSLPGVIPNSKRSSALVEGVDLLPTLLDLLGLPEADSAAGRSLLPILLGDPAAPAPESPIYSWSNVRVPREDAIYFDSEKLISVRLGRWKLERTTRKRGSLYHSYQLFDLESDPGETVDLWFREPVVGHTLRQSLEKKIRRDATLVTPAPKIEPLKRRVEENLRALGYVE